MSKRKAGFFLRREKERVFSQRRTEKGKARNLLNGQKGGAIDRPAMVRCQPISNLRKRNTNTLVMGERDGSWERQTKIGVLSIMKKAVRFLKGRGEVGRVLVSG